MKFMQKEGQLRVLTEPARGEKRLVGSLARPLLLVRLLTRSAPAPVQDSEERRKSADRSKQRTSNLAKP